MRVRKISRRVGVCLGVRSRRDVKHSTIERCRRGPACCMVVLGQGLVVCITKRTYCIVDVLAIEGIHLQDADIAAHILVLIP